VEVRGANGPGNSFDLNHLTGPRVGMNKSNNLESNTVAWILCFLYISHSAVL